MDWKTYEEINIIRTKMRKDIEAVLQRTEEALHKLQERKNAQQLFREI